MATNKLTTKTALKVVEIDRAVVLPSALLVLLRRSRSRLAYEHAKAEKADAAAFAKWMREFRRQSKAAAALSPEQLRERVYTSALHRGYGRIDGLLFDPPELNNAAGTKRRLDAVDRRIEHLATLDTNVQVRLSADGLARYIAGEGSF